jgi:hypothetical protein
MSYLIVFAAFLGLFIISQVQNSKIYLHPPPTPFSLGVSGMLLAQAHAMIVVSKYT